MFGEHAPQVVVKAQDLAHGSTVMGCHALEVKRIQKLVKVCFIKIFYLLSCKLLLCPLLQMRDHGQIGEYGNSVQQVVVKGPGLVHEDTVMVHHALGILQIQKIAKV